MTFYFTSYQFLVVKVEKWHPAMYLCFVALNSVLKNSLVALLGICPFEPSLRKLLLIEDMWVF